MGSIRFLSELFLLLVLSKAVMVLLCHLCIHRLGLAEMGRQPAAGFSGVLFGMMTIQAVQNVGGRFSFLGMATMPAWAAPFGYLIFTQILFRRTSFLVRFLFRALFFISVWLSLFPCFKNNNGNDKSKWVA